MRALITGGAGFIGTNAALYFAQKGWQICVADNLSRRGTSENLDWLRRQIPVLFSAVDVRDASAVDQLFQEYQPELVLHLAGQVAVTTSVKDPREDFEINARGSFNVIDAVRRIAPRAFFINASTNKVYGKLEHLRVIEGAQRFRYASHPFGVSENEPLDFHSPYGCSKGVADQYTIDFARIYGLQTVTFRQSCIYGERQLGIEDQGWVAWFAIAAALGKPLTIYGNGKQIRDVLNVQDLVRAYEAAFLNRERVAGRAYNIGGGPANTLSLLELLQRLRHYTGRDIQATHSDWRPGDQPVFVCDIRAAQRDFGWQPTIDVDLGVASLIDWVSANHALFAWI